jgi:hypothetical protein|tara:strand:+ start:2124 stop:2342 length:219 start_codon:yes stop_codon:yes gene_type:complete
MNFDEKYRRVDVLLPEVMHLKSLLVLDLTAEQKTQFDTAVNVLEDIKRTLKIKKLEMERTDIHNQLADLGGL